MTRRTPLWRTVLNDLSKRIESGALDGRFPTDRELMAEYDVSRHTVREAVRQLQATGKVTRHPGRGSQVQAPTFEQPLGTLYSLFESIEATGASQDSVVLARESRVNPAAAAILEVADDTVLFYLERIRLANGEPLAHDRVWIPGHLVNPLLEVDFSHTALYTELRDHCELFPESGRERIRPVMPTGDQAKLLDSPRDQPVLEIERRTTFRRMPLEWRITLVRGDRYSFRAEWRAEDTVVVPRLAAR